MCRHQFVRPDINATHSPESRAEALHLRTRNHCTCSPDATARRKETTFDTVRIHMFRRGAPVSDRKHSNAAWWIQHSRQARETAARDEGGPDPTSNSPRAPARRIPCSVRLSDVSCQPTWCFRRGRRRKGLPTRPDRQRILRAVLPPEEPTSCGAGHPTPGIDGTRSRGRFQRPRRQGASRRTRSDGGAVTKPHPATRPPRSGPPRAPLPRRKRSARVPGRPTRRRRAAPPPRPGRR